MGLKKYYLVRIVCCNASFPKKIYNFKPTTLLSSDFRDHANFGENTGII